MNSEKQHDKNPNLYNGETLDLQDLNSLDKKVYIESYGCQMNFSDSEIVASILGEAGYATTRELKEADLVLVNTVRFVKKQNKRSETDWSNLTGSKRAIPM